MPFHIGMAFLFINQTIPTKVAVNLIGLRNAIHIKKPRTAKAITLSEGNTHV